VRTRLGGRADSAPDEYLESIKKGGVERRFPVSFVSLVIKIYFTRFGCFYRTEGTPENRWRASTPIRRRRPASRWRARRSPNCSNENPCHLRFASNLVFAILHLAISGITLPAFLLDTELSIAPQRAVNECASPCLIAYTGRLKFNRENI
jgi:hypothetical protein